MTSEADKKTRSIIASGVDDGISRYFGCLGFIVLAGLVAFFFFYIKPAMNNAGNYYSSDVYSVHVGKWVNGYRSIKIDMTMHNDLTTKMTVKNNDQITKVTLDPEHPHSEEFVFKTGHYDSIDFESETIVDKNTKWLDSFSYPYYFDKEE